MTERNPEATDYPEMTMWETQCEKCGTYVLTDEWYGHAPYFGTRCECGGDLMLDEWQVSDEPHPASWQTA